MSKSHPLPLIYAIKIFAFYWQKTQCALPQRFVVTIWFNLRLVMCTKIYKPAVSTVLSLLYSHFALNQINFLYIGMYIRGSLKNNFLKSIEQNDLRDILSTSYFCNFTLGGL